MIKKVSVLIHGITPLLMKSCQGVNPLHPLVREKKEITGKKKKTDEDMIKLLDLDYRLALYWDDTVGVHVPANCVEATIRNAARKTKRGKQVVEGIIVQPDFIPLIYDGPKDVEGLLADQRFRDVRAGKLKGRESITVCRPRFNNWSLKFDLLFDESIFNLDEIKEILPIAGQYIGLCDYRPKYGKFQTVEVKDV